MTDIPNEWIEACTRALCAGPNEESKACAETCSACRDEARAAITILRPLIEAETRERCAQIAMLHDVNIVGGMEFYDSHSLDIAAAIRASALRAEGE